MFLHLRQCIFQMKQTFKNWIFSDSKIKINFKKLNTLLKPHNSIRIDWWRLQKFLVSIYSLKRMTPTKFCLFDQDTSITLFTINMNKIWTLDPFKTFIFADMTLLGSKVGKGGLEWPINKSLQWKEINIQIPLRSAQEFL